MENFELSLLAPLNFVSGIGLLILSTSARYTTIKTRLIDYARGSSNPAEGYIKNQVRRATLLKYSLLNLYLSILVLVSTSLMENLMPHFGFCYKVMMAINVLFIFIAIILLIIESQLSLDVVKLEVKSLKKNS